MQKLRHASLDENVSYVYLTSGICRSNIKRDIHVQKIKVENSVINSVFPEYKHLLHI